MKKGCFLHKPVKQFLFDQQGIMTIEFSIIFTTFLFLSFLFFEMCRYNTVSAAIDLTLTTAAREASAQSSRSTDYARTFSRVIARESGMIGGFIEPNRFSSSVTYCRTINDAIQGKCATSPSNGKYLAFYRVSYDYRPFIFNAIPGTQELMAALRNSLTRQLIYIQEYEANDLFKDD